MKIMPTLEGGLRIDVEDAATGSSSIASTTMPFHCDESLASRLGNLITDEDVAPDWQEYIVPGSRCGLSLGSCPRRRRDRRRRILNAAVAPATCGSLRTMGCTGIARSIRRGSRWKSAIISAPANRWIATSSRRSSSPHLCGPGFIARSRVLLLEHVMR